MSAADLFTTVDDVRFRLQGTRICLGKGLYRVDEVNYLANSSSAAANSILRLYDVNRDRRLLAPLNRLPLRAMYDCPVGYLNGIWFSRGPGRNRFQGITDADLWGYRTGLDLIDWPGMDLEYALSLLLRQPWRRKNSYKPRNGIYTRNIAAIPKTNYLMLRGEVIGELNDTNTVKLFSNEYNNDVLSELQRAAIVVM